MSSDFAWKVGSLVLFLFLMFTVSLIVITLIFVEDLKDNASVNQTLLTYVRVGNWIYVGVYFLSILLFVVSSSYIYKYFKFGDTSELGLEPAKK